VPLDEKLRYGLVVARCGRMLDRFDRQPTRSEPGGGSLVDLPESTLVTTYLHSRTGSYSPG
jgi:hypothetical protein